ncbi:MAG TPA: STY4851/ECs_5259 family protein [Candidatus Competibacteraceae bacterium]|nr:STY4851/ECs_5259 family protein [Candidatus Competibacteraceae bacterium]HRZ04836.1 STY4851/ECs_5259 family protein [Candidatus Competibacteraceae bacterium]HSA45443.1 STY4851/ECs_5259 family protein [Candidatus Competibacteraceae bacterium]
MNWLSRFLFAHTRQTEPDGRPLYAYKMRDDTYADLRIHFHQIIFWDSQGRLAKRFAPLFCLYAAETFRREHAEGSWAWETIFKPMKIDAPSQLLIADWVEKGLKWWRRPVLRSKSGHRLLLMSIACEGGLPLRLLQQENAHLTQFFRILLETYYRAGQGGEQVAETMARQQAHRLPRSLQQDPVFHLAAALIAKIGELQASLGEAVDPVAALDEKAPNWRRNLPLRLDDQAAETLLTGLVRRSGELVREAAGRPRWRGGLRETSQGWRVEKHLELPDWASNAQIAGWIGSPVTDQPPPRWRLLLHTSAGAETVAWLTLAQGTGPTARYHREWLHRGGVTLVGVKVRQPHRLSLHYGQSEYVLTAQNGEPWGDSPWVFVERGTSGEREWLTEGSARTRSERAWVLAEREFTPQAVNGACEFAGIIPELDRMVYGVSGEVELLMPQQDRYRIVCRAENDSQESFVVVGDGVPQLTQGRLLYRGLPQIQTIDPDGRRPPPTGRIQWRFVGDAAPWRERYEAARGRLWLRLIDASGAERCRRQVDVAPPDFQVEIDIGVGLQAGVVRLNGLAGADVQTGPDCPANVSITSTDNQARIVCRSLSGALPPPLTLCLQWPGSEPLLLTLPYPQRGALFRLAERSLVNDDWVPLDRLGGLHLLIQDPAGGRNFRLEGERIAYGEIGRRFHERLPPLKQGQLEMPLFVWQDRIASLLASSRNLEAQVRLTIETTQGERLASLRVTRFDGVLEPDRSAGQVRISEDSLARLGAGWETRVRLEMIRLWAPAEPPIALSACCESPAGWEIPADLEPGPWWIVGRDGDWTRFRPLLWGIATDDATAPDVDDSLAGAIRETDPEQRALRLNTQLAELGQNPDHPDWPLLFDYLQLAREFPPSSLDVLQRLPAHPRTLMLALMKADDETFEPTWTLSRQMPFLWMLLSIHDWREAAAAYFRGLQSALAEIDEGGEIVFGLFQRFRERAAARRIYWRSLCDWLQERLFPDRPPPNGELHIARRCPAFLEQQIGPLEQALQGRHDAEEKWPESSEIIGYLSAIDPKHRYLHLNPAYRPVRCSPFVAAHLSLNRVAPTESLIYELRLLRMFDREWFDHVYAIALTLCLAHRPPEI